MKVNYNMSAMVTNGQLMRTENSLTDVMERLSSGLRLNRSKDNPAGMAISNKMQLQIDGLNQASRNASDGSSVLQTVDGALDEVTNLLQRMRELSVQAATDTNSLDERVAIQQEIESLRDEIDRVSTDTEFNKKILLNGNQDVRVYAKNVSRVYTSDTVDPGQYEIKATQAAKKADMTADTAQFADPSSLIGTGGTIKINGSEVAVSAADTYEEVYEKLREGAEIGNAVASVTDDGSLNLTSSKYGQNAQIQIEISDAALATALGFASTKPAVVTGADAQIELEAGFSDSATVKEDGNRIVISDRDGFEISFMLDEGYPGPADDGSITFDVTEMGPMTLQIGANQYQEMSVRIPRIDTETLYLDQVDVRTVGGADRAIDEFDWALTRVLNARTSLGACDNRLEYAVNSLDETGENVTAALSRIQDADMAEEMTTYTQMNVLEQAAISVLTQANDLPQQTLQLLQ